MKCRASGSKVASVLVVGEAPGSSEERKGVPFCGASGHELKVMLKDAGILPEACRYINVTPYRPPYNKIELFFKKEPDIIICFNRYPHHQIQIGLIELQEEIDMLKPKVIIALGATALWALCGEEKISKWRGSLLPSQEMKAPIMYNNFECVIIPTYHPAAVLRQWNLRSITVHDFGRISQVLHSKNLPDLIFPKYNFIIQPAFSLTVKFLDNLVDNPQLISVDIETRGGFISCIGIAKGEKEAFCIPLMDVTRPEGYWTRWEEIEILLKLHDVLEKCTILGQNFLFDAQYLTKYMLAWPNCIADTMLMQNVAYPSVQKSLDFLASMYCESYRFWKNEGREWKPKYQSERQLWTYNCKDAAITFEVYNTLTKVLEQRNLREQSAFQLSLYTPVLKMMLRGIKIDEKYKALIALEIQAERSEFEAFFEELIGDHVGMGKKAKKWYASPKQVQNLFYKELKLPAILHKRTKKPTTDDAALTQIGDANPILLPLCNALAQYRSLGVYYNTFLNARLEEGRIYCSFNPAGTETFRFSSSKDAFNRGTNLQNIPRDE